MGRCSAIWATLPWHGRSSSTEALLSLLCRSGFTDRPDAGSYDYWQQRAETYEEAKTLSESLDSLLIAA